MTGFHFLGVGITYLGKRNHWHFFNNCLHCGRFSKIESYDVTACFSILIPLFPLARRRIIKSIAV